MGKECQTMTNREKFAEQILDILEHGYHDVDYKVHCGNKVFNPETKIFEEEK